MRGQFLGYFIDEKHWQSAVKLANIFNLFYA